MAFELDLTCITIKWYTKFQINMSKHVREKCGKLWRTDGRTDGRMDGRRPGRTDGRTDGHHHTIIRPVWRRAYKNVWRYKVGWNSNVTQTDRHREKRKRSDSVLWQKPLYQQECRTGKLTTQKVTKNFHYTAIVDWLRTVSWSNCSHPTGVVYQLTDQTFRLPATAV